MKAGTTDRRTDHRLVNETTTKLAMTSTAGKNKRKTILSRNKSPYTTDDENGTRNINDTKSMFTEIMSELKNLKKQND